MTRLFRARAIAPERTLRAHLSSSARRARSISSAASLAFAWLCIASAGLATAQHSGDPGNAPPPPPGPGQLTVQLLAKEASESLEGLSVALYALAPDGTPGLTDGVTDAKGRFVFLGISNDPDIVYLVGARYAGIPFGERVAFAPDSTQALVEIEVSSPTDRVSGVRIEELRARVEWMGDRVVVTEILRLVSSGDRVIQLAEGDSDETIVRRRLPPTARDFSAGPGSIGDGLALVDGAIRFWGPLYPGEQRVEYRYSLPVDPTPEATRQTAPESAPESTQAESTPRRLTLPVELREGAQRVVVVAGTTGIEVAGPGLTASRDLQSDTGTRLESWARGPLAAGQRIEVALTLPESRLDPAALSLPRADTWLELDDTRLTATVDLQLRVEPGPPISGTPEAPLMHVTIPTGAALEGVAPEAQSMGLVPTEDGGFDVIGPIGPGEHSLGYSYRMPSGADGVVLDMRFPREVATLNVLIADTGLALDSDRLHRRRPFRSGTRNYLHREAFNVSPDEIVDLEIEPLSGEGLPQQASMALVVAGAAAAGLFLMAPLRRSTTRDEEEDVALARIRHEREAVYTAIADLDHDFETGKLDASDYQEMRDEMRDQAIELLRAERAGDAAAETAEATARAATPTAPSPAGPSAAQPPHAGDIRDTANVTRPPATSRFCPSCGGQIDARWRFCSHCGGALQPETPQPETLAERHG